MEPKPMPTRITAAEYQILLLQLPALNYYDMPGRRYVAQILAVGGRTQHVFEQEQPPVVMSQAIQVEFELVHNRPLPFWQPTKPIHIYPVKNEL